MAQPPYDLRNRNLSQAAEDTNPYNPEPGLQDLQSKEGQYPDPQQKTPPHKHNPIINMKDFIEVDMDEKLNLLMSAINKVNTNLHLKMENLQKAVMDPKEGISARVTECENDVTTIKKVLNDEQEGALPRLRDAESTLTDLQEQMDTLEGKTAHIQHQLALVIGTLQVQDKQLSSNHNKIVDLTARSMSNNLISLALLGTTKKRTVWKKQYTSSNHS